MAAVSELQTSGALHETNESTPGITNGASNYFLSTAQLPAVQTDNEGGEIWSSILGRAATTGTTKSVLCKTLLVCGDHSNTKFNLVDALSESVLDKDPVSSSDFPDLGLSYSYMDINDDENDAVARIGIYQLTDDPVYHSLLDFALTNENIWDSLAIITLDWMEMHVRGYTESAATINRILGSTTDLFESAQSEPHNQNSFGLPDSLSLPLGSGVLNKSIGLPIVVVCCQAEILTDHERDYKEDKLGYIQQTLRTICLSYGAALFYVSQQRPDTIINLRSYILHRLLSKNSQTVNSDTVQSSRKLAGYEFTGCAQTVECDAVSIPAGWDSWGKIRVLRDGFPCEVYSGINDSDLAQSTQDPTSGPLYMPALIEPENDQDFLQKHLPLLMKLDEQSRVNSSAGTSLASSPASNPMTTSQLLNDKTASHSTADAPASTNTQITTSREVLEDLSAKVAKQQATAKRILERANSGSLSKYSNSAGGAAAVVGGSGSTGSGGAGITAGSQEVLANFFQSLLAKKGASGNVPGGKSLSPLNSRRVKSDENNDQI
ncbi:hypothetical protein BDEG_20709 [Batrachochytrium dendrobatidis JEL423]|uniref:Dynein light intermediate chain n=1 Tax=Batrachochytrium dendrobatidis (strain JEL423) TaxID=403673 RepID=A0A177W9T4_BATDL|nr:hypothetical protein BDEG_20709 [Batrachochytrium dendrobatidis JEL423]